MKKIKQIYPSRNYITVDAYGDVEVVFNPVGDGFEGEDKLVFRRGRWAFRINDFLAGKVLADGTKESMNRKVYTLNLVYDDKDREPQVTTTYVDPTSVIPLDGSIVVVDDLNKIAQEETLQNVGSSINKVVDYMPELRSGINSVKAMLEKEWGIKPIYSYITYTNDDLTASPYGFIIPAGTCVKLVREKDIIIAHSTLLIYRNSGKSSQYFYNPSDDDAAPDAYRLSITGDKTVINMNWRTPAGGAPYIRTEKEYILKDFYFDKTVNAIEILK